MPTEMIVFAVILALLIAAGLGAFVYWIVREILVEQQEPVPEWDTNATMELYLLRQEQDNDKRRCPYCQATRCADRDRPKGCAEQPTLAPVGDILAVGKHYRHTLSLVPSNWWPLPATRMGRANPDLWEKLLRHSPIVVNYRRAYALP